jgi:hypothetical protein
MEVGYERRGCKRFMVSPFAGTLLRIALFREIDACPGREGRVLQPVGSQQQPLWKTVHF